MKQRNYSYNRPPEQLPQRQRPRQQQMSPQQMQRYPQQMQPSWQQPKQQYIPQKKKRSIVWYIVFNILLFMFFFVFSFFAIKYGSPLFIETTATTDIDPATEQVVVLPEKILPTPEPEPPKVVYENGAHYIVYQDYKIIFANKNYKSSPEVGGEDPEAFAALERMIADLHTETGLEIYLVSGYRSYYDQEAIYNNFVQDRGQENADLISAQPGASEHQLGNTFDLLGTSANTGLSTKFADTPEYEWLINNCHEYGFILRYLEGKTFATSYSFEPWHYRYLGDVELATDIMESGLSLEEYFGLVETIEQTE